MSTLRSVTVLEAFAVTAEKPLPDGHNTLEVRSNYRGGSKATIVLVSPGGEWFCVMADDLRAAVENATR